MLRMMLLSRLGVVAVDCEEELRAGPLRDGEGPGIFSSNVVMGPSALHFWIKRCFGHCSSLMALLALLWVLKGGIVAKKIFPGTYCHRRYYHPASIRTLQIFHSICGEPFNVPLYLYDIELSELKVEEPSNPAHVPKERMNWRQNISGISSSASLNMSLILIYHGYVFSQNFPWQEATQAYTIPR
jgi:hypothetical protein